MQNPLAYAAKGSSHHNNHKYVGVNHYNKHKYVMNRVGTSLALGGDLVASSRQGR